MTDVASPRATVTSGTEGTVDEGSAENASSPFASTPVMAPDSPAAAAAAAAMAASRPLVALDADLGPLQDGEHRVDLPGGVVYFGEIKGGRLEGRGLILFPAGARYEGALAAGRAQGPGVYVGSEAEGTFFGTWDKGRMHGEIVHTRTQCVGGGEGEGSRRALLAEGVARHPGGPSLGTPCMPRSEAPLRESGRALPSPAAAPAR